MADPQPARDDVPLFRRRAAALRYDHDREPVPRVVARGQGRLAERIVEVARENGVTIREDPDLVELLYRLEVDRLIPEKLFVAVAEVMAYVYRVNQRTDEIRRLLERAP